MNKGRDEYKDILNEAVDRATRAYPPPDGWKQWNAYLLSGPFNNMVAIPTIIRRGLHIDGVVIYRGGRFIAEIYRRNSNKPAMKESFCEFSQAVAAIENYIAQDERRRPCK